MEGREEKGEKWVKRSVQSLNKLPKATREKYVLEGYLNTAQLDQQQYEELNLELDFNIREMKDLLKEKSYCLKWNLKEIDKMFCLYKGREKIKEELEILNDSGIPLKSIVEITGILGIGKTSLCLQLALNLLLPKRHNDYSVGQTIFIVTDGSLSSTLLRLKNMCNGLEIDFEEISSNLHFYEVFDYKELIELLKYFVESDFIKQNEVKLMVIDSISFPFYHFFGKFQLKAFQVNKFSGLLNSITCNNEISVLVTNQLIVAPHCQANDPFSPLIPSLGEMWTLIPNHQLLLHYNMKSEKCITLSKSSTFKKETIKFNFDSNGLITFNKVLIQKSTTISLTQNKMDTHTSTKDDTQLASISPEELTNPSFHPEPNTPSQGEEEEEEEEEVYNLPITQFTNDSNYPFTPASQGLNTLNDELLVKILTPVQEANNRDDLNVSDFELNDDVQIQLDECIASQSTDIFAKNNINESDNELRLKDKIEPHTSKRIKLIQQASNTVEVEQGDLNLDIENDSSLTEFSSSPLK